MVASETIQLLLTALGPVSFGLSYILFRILRNMVKSTVFGWASEFKNAMFDEIVKNPEIFMPLVASFMKKFGQQTAGGSGGGTFKVFGFPVPKEIMGQIMAYGARKLIPGVEEAGNAAGSPFG